MFLIRENCEGACEEFHTGKTKYKPGSEKTLGSERIGKRGAKMVITVYIEILWSGLHIG
jgi:hypothetical protein